MRILANENFPGPVIRALRQRGHDVVSVKETMRGASDPQVLARAQAEERLVVAFDKDFGELAFRFGLPARCGVSPGKPSRVGGVLRRGDERSDSGSTAAGVGAPVK